MQVEAQFSRRGITKSKASTTSYGGGTRRPKTIPVVVENAASSGRKGKRIHSSLLRESFLQRLPANVQMIPALADSMIIDNLAEMADRIMDVATPTISSVSTSSEGGDFRKIIREDVAAALLTQGS